MELGKTGQLKTSQQQ